MENDLPVGFTMRPPTLDDAQALADMMNAQTQVLVGRFRYSEESVRGILSDPALDMQEQSRIIESDVQQIAAYVAVWNSEPYVETGLTFNIHPEYEHLGLRQILMTWGEALAISYVAKAPADAQVVIDNWTFSTDTAAIAYLEQANFKAVRNFYNMGINLDQSLFQPKFPPNIQVKTFPELNDLKKLHYAIDESFQDHWGYISEPEEKALNEFRHWIDNYPNVDTQYWYLAMDGDEIAGISLCLPYLVGQENVAYVDTLGVRKPWRRQGIALALLHYSFQEMQKLGQDKVTLDVDASSLTGATRLYEKAGMNVLEYRISWEKILRNGKDYRTQELA